FFFQAEDGIRDRNVTEVQTCALPIYFFYRYDGETCIRKECFEESINSKRYARRASFSSNAPCWHGYAVVSEPRPAPITFAARIRSEERRVGKECRCRSGS